LMDTHIPNMPKKFKWTSICQIAGGNSLLSQERSADGKIHATRDHNIVSSILWNTKTSAYGRPIRTKAWNADIRYSTPW
jgi:hypothetical protein